MNPKRNEKNTRTQKKTFQTTFSDSYFLLFRENLFSIIAIFYCCCLIASVNFHLAILMFFWVARYPTFCWADVMEHGAAFDKNTERVFGISATTQKQQQQQKWFGICRMNFQT
jgi:Na+/melibiose symporter-like transporter